MTTNGKSNKITCELIGDGPEFNIFRPGVLYPIHVIVEIGEVPGPTISAVWIASCEGPVRDTWIHQKVWQFFVEKPQTFEHYFWVEFENTIGLFTINIWIGNQRRTSAFAESQVTGKIFPV